MTICRFFQQGNCRFGSSCRNEHPRSGASPNPFGVLQNSNGNGNGGNNSLADGLEKYNLGLDIIEKDLTSERPTWILSAYGPGRLAPDQLFGGPMREQSFEEVRLGFYEAKAAGNEQQALNAAQQVYQQAEEQIRNSVQNLRDAAIYVLEGENRHPNRFDVCKEGTQGAPFGVFSTGKQPNGFASNPFATNNNNITSNTNNNTLGGPTSGFGSAAQPTVSAFGQPSALGQRTNPFGQPSQPTSAFGQPSQLGASTPFGQPPQNQPAFGQPSTMASAFGQPSAMGAKPNPFGSSTFGQPSSMGQKPNPFGSTSAPSASPFGTPTPAAVSNASANLSANPFAPLTANNAASPSPFATAGSNTNNNADKPNPFATANGPGTNTSSPFGQVNNNQNNATSSPFGQPSTAPSNPFGQPNPQPSNPFATSAGPASSQAAKNPFAPTSQTPNGMLGQQADNAQTASPNPFGQPPNGNVAPNPFGQPSQPQRPSPQQSAVSKGTGNPYPPDSGKQHPPIEQYAVKGMDGRLSTFKGKSVTFKEDKPGAQDFGGKWTRIWFPEGPPAFNKDTALKAGDYDDTSKAQWTAFEKAGVFADGVMPGLPPPRECTRWDF